MFFPTVSKTGVFQILILSDFRGHLFGILKSIYGWSTQPSEQILTTIRTKNFQIAGFLINSLTFKTCSKTGNKNNMDMKFGQGLALKNAI